MWRALERNTGAKLNAGAKRWMLKQTLATWSLKLFIALCSDGAHNHIMDSNKQAKCARAHANEYTHMTCYSNVGTAVTVSHVVPLVQMKNNDKTMTWSDRECVFVFPITSITHLRQADAAQKMACRSRIWNLTHKYDLNAQATNAIHVTYNNKSLRRVYSRGIFRNTKWGRIFFGRCDASK